MGERDQQHLPRRLSARSRRWLVAFALAAVVLGAGVAHAAFVATTVNPGNSVAAASSFGRCLVGEVMDDNPAGYWRMDDSGSTMVDHTGSNNGYYQSGVQRGQSGALGDPANKAALFGNGQAAAVNDSPALQLGDTFTLETWVRLEPAGVGQFNTLIYKGLQSTGGGPLIRIRDNGILDLIRTSSPNVLVASSTAKITDTAWHHVVATKSGATSKLYIDGVDRTATAFSATMPSTAGTQLIFSAPEVGPDLKGRLDEVAVYPTALPAARVRAHFNAGRCWRDEPRADGPTAVWRLGETAGSPVGFDGAGQGHGTFRGPPTLGVTSPLLGESDTAATFGSAGQRLEIPDRPAFDVGDSFSIETWFKRSSAPDGGAYRLLSMGSGGAALTLSSTDRLVLHVDGGSSVVSASKAITDTDWHHVVAVKNGSTARMYLDGVDLSVAHTATTFTDVNAPLRIGASFLNGNVFKGSLDEMALYGSPLSAARVRDHYVAGRSYRDVVMASGPVNYWRLGESSGSVSANEIAGGAYGVAFQGGYTRGVSGAVAGDGDSSVTFNGSTGYGASADQPSQRMPGNMTLETWVRPGAAPSDFARIAGKGANTARNYGLWIDSTRQIFFQQCSSGCSQVRTSPASSAIPLNEWTHLAATVSGNSLTLYVNGQSIGTSTTALTPVTTTDNFSLAAAGYHSALNGSIDDTALFDRALPADEVALHYAAGIRQPR